MIEKVIVNQSVFDEMCKNKCSKDDIGLISGVPVEIDESVDGYKIIYKEVD